MVNAKIPDGPLKDKWTLYKNSAKVVNVPNKRKYHVIVVGTGLGGASAAASLSELGYNVKVFCIQDSPRRAHSIAAQGGINAAKTIQMTETASIAFFTTQSKAATSEHGRLMFIVWPR